MSKIIQLYRDNAGRAKQPVNLVRNESEATIYIYDVIDAFWGISAKGVVDALTQAAGVATLHIRINSPGGDVMESRAIIEAIKRFDGKTIAHIDGLAASAATSVAIAADEVEISDGGFFMIHNASAMVWGDKSDMRETADLLEKVEGVIVAEYAAETGQDAAQIITWMDAETWFTAQEAIDAGFVDRLSPTAVKAKNAWNLAAFDKAPSALTAPTEPEPAQAPTNTAPPEPAPAAEPVAAPANVVPEPSMTQSNKNRLTLALAL